MKATIEISMYSLCDQYEERVIQFIKRIQKNKNIRVEINGLSTQLFGDYDLLMSLVKNEMQHDFETGKAVFILKIGAGELTKEKLPSTLLS